MMNAFMKNIIHQFPNELKEIFEERAAIMQYHGKLPGHMAEHYAFLNYVDDMTAQRYLDSKSSQSELNLS